VAGGGLIAPEANDFPHIPGVTYSGMYNVLSLHDYATLPPREGATYPALVGRVDRDGNMIDGIRPPTLSAPIGTHTGWNLRREGFAEGAQCGSTGSFIPFASTRAEREAWGDPRLSLQERYSDPQAYVYGVALAAGKLVGERLLLPQDAEEIIEAAEESVTPR